jgi:hypothetical protein
MKRPNATPPGVSTRVVTLDDVVASTTASGAPSPAGGLRRATVRAVRQDGAIEVGTKGERPETFVCDVLDGADRFPEGFREGDEVVAMLPQVKLARGCILGRVRQGRPAPSRAEVPETLVLEAGRELVLRVGEGSITIRADGKILIKGKDLVSHAKRMNRIKGGSVSLN